MRRLSRWAVLLGLALLLGASAYYLLDPRAAEAPTAKPSGGQASAAKPSSGRVAVVEVARVSVDTVLDTIQAVGTLRPNEAVMVSPEIAGRIARLPFVEGEKVTAGDPLVILDSAILRAEVAKARSDFTLAEANRNRAMTLASKGTGTLRARDEAVAAYQAAQANLALARARLEKATVTAPLSGVVGMRAFSVGAFVSPGDRIVELAEVDPIKIEFRVPELALPRLRVGQKIRVAVDAFPGRSFEGEIYVIDPIVDASGRAVRLRARVPNGDATLSPGLFARVQIVVDRRENAMIIPESAVFADGAARYVYRVADGRAVQTRIELGKRLPGKVEIRAGLEPDWTVVVAGHQKVRNGSPVTVAGAAERPAN